MIYRILRRRIAAVAAGALAVVIMAWTAITIIGFAENAQDTREELKRQGRHLIECNTPGTRVTTPDDPSTGHVCFDQQQERTSKAVSQIVDTNANQQPDIQDLADALGVTLNPGENP